MRSTLSVLAAAFAVVAAAGCSGGDEQSPTAAGTSVTATTAPDPAESTATRPEPPADQSRWATQVDAACRPWQERIDALAPPASADGLGRWLGNLLPLVRKQVRAVKAVKPPAKRSEAKQAAVFIESLTTLERSLTRYRAALAAGDDAATQRALVDANTAGAAARNYALVLEITQCGGYSDG